MLYPYLQVKKDTFNTIPSELFLSQYKKLLNEIVETKEIIEENKLQPKIVSEKENLIIELYNV